MPDSHTRNHGRALVITEPGSIALHDVPELTPGPGEVVARPMHVGICGTDIELLNGVVDPAYVRYPLIPGHEWSGVIESAGPGVTGLTPGQPVISEGIVPDRICASCVRGLTNLCVTYDELGFTRPGAAAGQLLVPAQLVHPLPESVSLPEAALAEPAAVAWRAIGLGALQPGERVAVVGDGTVALIATHLLRLFSPADLVVHGQRPAQEPLARQLGATAFEVADDGAAHGRPGAFDLVLEAAGTAAAVERAISLARRGGRVVMLGLAGNGVTAKLPIDDAVNNDLSITASFAYTSASFAEVAALLAAGQLNLAPLITHRYPLAAYEEAYRALRTSTALRGKILLDI